MKVTKYSLVGDSTIDLPVSNVSPSDSIILKSIDGLGPPDFNINIGPTIYPDGNFQNSLPQPRQLVIQVRLNPKYALGETVEGLREELYQTIGTDFSDGVDFQIWNGATQKAHILGWVSKCEIVPFSKDQEVQITIECIGAYFTAPTTVNVDLSAMPKNLLTVVNDGSVASGFRLQITFTGAPNDFAISRSLTDKFELVYAFATGDILTIDTRDGNRDVFRDRGGISLSLVDNMTSDSNWLKLKRGSNLLGISYTAFNYNNLLYLPTYLGV